MAIPLVLAGLLSQLASNGLDLIGKAVTAKGKEVVEKTLGVKLEDEVKSEEGLLKLKQLEMEHEEFLINAATKQAAMALESEKLSYADTSNARDNNAKIQESAHASYLAKNMPYWIDGFIVSMTFMMAYFLLFKEIPNENKEAFYTAFGSLMTLCMTVVNFHRGSSAKSQAKDDTINKIATGGLK